MSGDKNPISNEKLPNGASSLGPAVLKGWLLQANAKKSCKPENTSVQRSVALCRETPQ